MFCLFVSLVAWLTLLMNNSGLHCFYVWKKYETSLWRLMLFHLVLNWKFPCMLVHTIHRMYGKYTEKLLNGCILCRQIFTILSCSLNSALSVMGEIWYTQQLCLKIDHTLPAQKFPIYAEKHFAHVTISINSNNN